jgi:hypothetical protein
MPCLWQVKAIVEGDGDAVADAPRRHASVPLKRQLPALVYMNGGAAANMGGPAIGPSPVRSPFGWVHAGELLFIGKTLAGKKTYCHSGRGIAPFTFMGASPLAYYYYPMLVSAKSKHLVVRVHRSWYYVLLRYLR